MAERVAALRDDAVRTPWALRAHALRRGFRDEIGPDGVTYPNIGADVPAGARAEVATVLADLVGGPVDVKLTFFRLSLEVDQPPHWAHTDAILSDHLALLYLTRPEDCQGGTAIVAHHSGMARHPRTPEEEALWRRDTNRREAWEVLALAPMAFNRLVVLPTDLFHAALPSSFGTAPENGRLVLITFFDRNRKET